MKIHIRVAAGVSIEIEGDDQKELFEKLAGAQEVFGAESNCGLCDSQRLRFRVRVADKYKFYQLDCLDCGARFVFGQITKGGLFPKRFGEDHQPLANRGWEHPPKMLPASGSSRGRK